MSSSSTSTKKCEKTSTLSLFQGFSVSKNFSHHEIPGHVRPQGCWQPWVPLQQRGLQWTPRRSVPSWVCRVDRHADAGSVLRGARSEHRVFHVESDPEL